MDSLDSITQRHTDPDEFAAAYLQYVGRLASRLDPQAIGQFIRRLLEAREASRTVFFLGNGGSAATASHFANDVGIGTRATKRPFRAMSLTDNAAVMTAVANDDGYDQMFVRQLQVLMRPGDVVVAISASGNSPNVVEAVRYAREYGNAAIALTGFDGGRLRQLADLTIHVPTPAGEYGPVEDLHMIIDHLVGAFLGRIIREERENGLEPPFSTRQ